MDIEQRLEHLENAHRELAAQHTALQLVCRMMLPLIRTDPATTRLKLLAAYDANNTLMDAHGFDAEYQTTVRHWLDVLSGEILKAANTPAPHPSADE